MLEFLGNIGSGILNYLGGQDANAINRQNAERNIELQREFAQHGIRWKVADAQAAGIHPLYALGASTSSFSPVSVGATNAMSPLAEMSSKMGQDLSRAVDSKRTGEERVAARLQTAGAGLELENMKLRNDLLRAQIAKINQAGQPPAMPDSPDNYLIPGQGDSRLVKPKALEVAPGHPGQPSVEGGAIADAGYARTPTGWAPVPSKDVKERIEDNWYPEFMWSMRNMIIPSTQFFGQNPPPFKPRAGHVWRFNPVAGEYQEVPDRSHVWRRAWEWFKN